MAVLEATRFEQAALLRAKGLKYVGAELVGRRVVLRFDDPQGEGAALLARHSIAGVMVNSAQFEAGLTWAKDRVFETRKD